LTRSEFERRYEATPQLKKAELIEGVAYMPSPARLRRHAGPHADLITWLGLYRVHTPGLEIGDNGTVRLDLENEPQPDATLIIDPACGGQSMIDADDYVAGAPELVAEIASSSGSFDLHTKFRVYRRNGVREYIVWRVIVQTIDWFVLRGSDYERLSAGADGVSRSEVFPGLWLDAASLVRRDIKSVVEILERGIASSDHAAFVAKLQQNRRTEPR